MKIEKDPSAFLYPCPVVLVTSLDSSGRKNIITLAWVGIVCSNPPIISLGIRPERYSSQIIDETREFVINIPSTNLLKETDYCGMVSGRRIDKFAETRLTSKAAKKVKAHIIKECPVNLECVLRSKIDLGVHSFFLGEVVATHIDQALLDEEGNLDCGKAEPIVYNQGEYWSLGRKIGVYGFSKNRDW